jgi:hypothetical protein
LAFFLFEQGIKLLNRVAAWNELRVVHGIHEEFVGWLDVAFNDFLQVFKEFFSAYLELGANRGPWGLSMLLDVDMNDVLIVELPRQCDVVISFGAWPEKEFTDISITKLFHSSRGVYIQELRVIDPSWNKPSCSMSLVSISRGGSYLKSMIY